jgi:hypothetical protein
MINSVAKGTNSFLQSTTTAANSALSGVSDLLSSSTSTVVNSAVKAANSVSNSLNSGIETMNDTFQDVIESTTTALESVPILNSLVSGSNGHTGSNNSHRNGHTGSNNSHRNGYTGSNTSNTGNIGSNASKNANANSTQSGSSLLTAVGVFILLLLIFLFILSMFNAQISIGINNIIATVRRAFGLNSPPPVPIVPGPPVLPSGTVTDKKPSNAVTSSIVDKLLPTGHKEVFNISENEYTYYDAEPLCRALGAELATYSQVKNAWEKGADWCNYGWVKGQAAVYPTQSDTWDKLQHGPEDEKYACGNPGVNGGFFDNPEMRFGVNCYGKKPAESSNDEVKIMGRGGLPRTPATLKVDKQIQEYKNSLDTIGILPFSSDAWSD